MNFTVKITVDDLKEIDLSIVEPSYILLSKLMEETNRYLIACTEVSSSGIVSSVSRIIDDDERDKFLIELSIQDRQDTIENINFILKNIMKTYRLEEEVKEKIYDALIQTYDFIDSEDEDENEL